MGADSGLCAVGRRPGLGHARMERLLGGRGLGATLNAIGLGAVSTPAAMRRSRSPNRPSLRSHGSKRKQIGRTRRSAKTRAESRSSHRETHPLQRAAWTCAARFYLARHPIPEAQWGCGVERAGRHERLQHPDMPVYQPCGPPSRASIRTPHRRRSPRGGPLCRASTTRSEAHGMVTPAGPGAGAVVERPVPGQRLLLARQRVVCRTTAPGAGGAGRPGAAGLRRDPAPPSRRGGRYVQVPSRDARCRGLVVGALAVSSALRPATSVGQAERVAVVVAAAV